MKKTLAIITLLVSLLFTAEAARSGSDKASAADIESAKAIMARNLLANSKKTGSESQQKLKALPSQGLTVEKVVTSMAKADQEKHKGVIDAIKKSAPAKDATIDAVITYYSATLINAKGEIESATKSLNVSGADLKASIKKELSVLTQDNSMTLPPETETTDDGAGAGAEVGTGEDAGAKVEESAESDSSFRPDSNVEEDENVTATPLWMKLALIVFTLGLIVAVCYFFIMLRKAEKRIETSHERNVKLSSLLTARENEIADMRRQIASLKQHIVQIQDENEMRMRSREQRAGGGGLFDKERDGRGSYQRQETREARPVKQDFYGVNASDGVFQNLGRSYRRGEYLYHIETEGGDTAQYEFINDASAVGLARSSRSELIESACEILNDDVRSFNSVITVSKGQLAKDGNGWRIVRKAQVRLA